MKKLLLIVLPLLILLGAGGGAAYYMFFMKEETVEAEPEPPPPPPDPELVALEPITVPVIRQGSVRKFVLLKITLQLKDQEGKEMAIVAMPRIRDESIRALHSYFASVPLDAPLSIPSIRKRLRRVVTASIGSAPLIKVLIEGIFEKRAG